VELETLPLAERFRGYSHDDLGVTILSFVARSPELDSVLTK
jgi:hypothetical protein